MFSRFLRSKLITMVFCASLVVIALPFSRVQALEVSGGSINDTPPGTTFNGHTFNQPLPWYNVGNLNGSSAIYLGNIGNDGNYWVLTADHVAPALPSTVSFNSTDYSTVPGSYIRLKNADNSDADMVLFRININSDPTNLVTLSLRSTTPSLGSDLYYVGTGGTMRWGYNNVQGYTYGNDGFGNMQAFYSDYSTGSGNPNEGQGVPGDSGGAAFVYNTSTNTWELGGMLFSVNSDNTITFSGDIATYRSSILAVIPEPGAGWLFSCGAGVLFAACAVWRKRLPVKRETTGRQDF